MGNYKVWAAFAVATVVFYFTPLFDTQASIQWDAVDVHYSAQKYFADSFMMAICRIGLPTSSRDFPSSPTLKPPLGTPCTGLFSPSESLRAPSSGSSRCTPSSPFVELICCPETDRGPHVLRPRRRLLRGGGFFAGHSSHVGIFETAALLPWLLWAALRALENPTLPPILLTGGIGGLIVLIGHFQTALYSFCALALLLIARARPGNEPRPCSQLPALASFLLGAIQILPGLELTAQSTAPPPIIMEPPTPS